MTEAERIFSTRIMGMMEDYQCTMQEALVWDFDSMIYREMAAGSIVDEFRSYLTMNGIDLSSEVAAFYADIFLGLQNYALRKVKVK